MNKYILTALACFALAGSYALAQNMAQGNLGQNEMGRLAQEAQRDCIFPVGGWTIINCSAAAAAQSGQLDAWSRYVLQCGDDSYIATGDAATDEADSNDGWLPAGTWLPFITTGDIRYMSCLNKNIDSDCRYWACQ